MSSKSAAHFNLRSPWNQPQRRQGGRRTKPPAGCQAAGSGQKPLQRPGGRKAKTHLSQHERPRCQRPAHLKISHAKLGIGASKAAVSPIHVAIRLRRALTRVEISVSPSSRFHEWTREALETPALARYLPGPSARYVARLVIDAGPSPGTGADESENEEGGGQEALKLRPVLRPCAPETLRLYKPEKHE